MLWLSFSIFAMSLAVSSGAPGFATSALLLFVLIGFGLTLGPSVTQTLRYKNTKYAITDQRLITQTEAIGLDTRFVDLDKIQEVHVKVDLMDKIFRTGTLIVVTAGFVFVGVACPFCCFVGLKEPYAVQKLLQETMHTHARSLPL